MLPLTKPLENNHSKQAGSSSPHIIPALTALLIFIGVIIYSNGWASSLEDHYIHALARGILPQSVIGSVLQQAAFRQPDLLPIYGSSEMLNGHSPYRGFIFFSTYPTGFEVFDIAKGGNTSLNIAQDLAAIGTELKGKKVVISFTPSSYIAKEVPDNAYAANFSRIHAYALAFSPNLSMPLKQTIAARMLEYPDTLAHDPVLSFALQNLARDTFLNSLMYYMVFPLGQLDSFVIRMQDHYAVWDYIHSHPGITPSVLRQPVKIDWNALIAKAKALSKADSSSNPYGIDNKTWVQQYHRVLRIKKSGSSDKLYIANMERSGEWVDLELTLQVLKELGADPVIMSHPINGILYTASGISTQAQQAYYSVLQVICGYYQIPLVDFQEYTKDPLFSIDMDSHTSQEGWVIIDRALDAYYHGIIH